MSDQLEDMAQPEVGQEQEASTQESREAVGAGNTSAVDSASEAAAGDQDIATLKALDETAVSSSGGNAANFDTGSGAGEGQNSQLNMDSLMDVPVTLSVEIGRKRMPINQLVDLAPGAIVDLNRDLDAPLDLLVNGTLIARGEVVVMGKKFGLRLVDICSPNERVRGLAN